MDREAKLRGGVPKQPPPDSGSWHIAKAINARLESIHNQFAMLEKSGLEREEALHLLRKLSPKGKQGKSIQRAGARTPIVWQPIFLAALRMIPNARLACDAACISEKTAYKHRKLDLGFKEKWADAEEAGVALLHATAFHRAVIGDPKPVFQDGKCVGYTIEYSDRLLELLLKAHMPAMFRQHCELGTQAG